MQFGHGTEQSGSGLGGLTVPMATFTTVATGTNRSRFVVLSERTDPDVAESDSVSVLVEFDEPMWRMRFVVVA